MKNSLMQRIIPGVLFLVLPILWAGTVFAAKVNVPGDFPGLFRMDLLAWDVYVTDPVGGQVGTTTLDIVDNYIDFKAEAFDGAGSGIPTFGTSALSSWASDFLLGSGIFFGESLAFYMDGTGSGTLVDNGDGTGDWTLTIPLYTNFSASEYIHMTDLTLTTIGSVTYFDYALGHEVTTNGVAMNYETGDAVIVGMTTATDGPFPGFSGTFVIQGNDPIVASAVPEPTSILLIASSLTGLAGLRRKK